MSDSRLILPDLWQQDALRALRQGEDVVIQAPTRAGKTYVFELLIKGGHHGQAVYTVPTRALANDKRAEWLALGWDVGIATGDVSDNLGAPVIVATLETQRHRFLEGRHPDLLVGTESFDDAGVFRIDERTALVQTLDYFPPLVDDPFTFGQIAAIFPVVSIRKVVRSIPIYFLPYMLFSTQTP